LNYKGEMPEKQRNFRLDDGVASEGASTAFTDDDPGRVGVPEGYYRVRKN
jgi:hypothetical protein